MLILDHGAVMPSTYSPSDLAAKAAQVFIILSSGLYRPFPDHTLSFYYFWIIPKSIDRLFYGNLSRARKESWIGPQASAGICSS